MMHPDTRIQFISEEIGFGVVATNFIPRGAITWVQDDLDQVYTPQQVDLMNPVLQQMMDKYSFRNNKGNFVLCWDISKYVNHSFRSNCLSTAYDFEIAIRDIEEGEELTDDYGYLNVTEPFPAKNEGTERTTVYPDDLLKYHTEWDRKLENSFQFLHKVRQPLFELIPPGIRRKVEEVGKGEQKMDSIINLFYHKK